MFKIACNLDCVEKSRTCSIFQTIFYTICLWACAMHIACLVLSTPRVKVMLTYFNQNLKLLHANSDVARGVLQYPFFYKINDKDYHNKYADSLYLQKVVEGHRLSCILDACIKSLYVLPVAKYRRVIASLKTTNIYV